MTTRQAKITSWIFILLPAIVFFSLFFYFTVDAPINDDYSAILGFINSYVTTPTLIAKLQLLIEQANEHRITYDRVWTIVSYTFFHKIDFNFLSLIGNLSLVGIGAFFFIKFKEIGKPVFLFIPVSVLLFNLASWENITFAMATLSNFTVYLFILLSLHYASVSKGHKKNILLATLFLGIALYTQGGALSLIPVSTFVLLSKKEYKNFFIYICISTLLLTSYFVHYTSPQHNGSITDSLLELKGRVVLFAFSFLGNAFNYFLIYTNNMQESVGITAIIGFCLFVLFLYITKRKYYQRNSFNYSVMLLVVFTSFLTALTRSSFGWDFAASSRYRINSIIFLISAYFWLLESFPIENKKTRTLTLGLAALYFLEINVNHYEYLGIREQQTNFGIMGYQSGKPELLNGDKTQIETYTKILKESAYLNTYHLPTKADLSSYYPYAKKQQALVINDNPDLEMPFSVREVNQLGDDYFIDGFAFVKGSSTRNQKVYIGFKNQNESHPIFFSCKQIARYDLNPYFNKFNLKDGGYLARIHVGDIKPGENSIWLMVAVNGQTKIAETDKKITR
jgi:hypothetical protein